MLLGAAPARAARPPEARLRALESRYTAHLLADRPDLASGCGLARADDRLVPVTEASLERDRALLASLADSAAALADARLAPRARAALDTLRARIAREREPLERGAWHSDPSLYLALARDAVLGTAMRAHVSPCERTRRAAKRLAAVPEVLRAAEVNLRGAAFDRAAAVAAWTAAMARLRGELPPVGEACGDGAPLADLVEADSLALDAARRFVRFLGEAPGTAPPAGR